MTEAEYDTMMDINVKAVYFVAQAAARRMAARGHGVIINLSSVAGLQGTGNVALYCATKGAVRLLTYSIAQELGPRGIRVNALHPGFVETTMTTVDVPVVGTEYGDQLIAENPLGRAAQPADIANGALFLASDLSSYVNGASLSIDGGMLRI